MGVGASPPSTTALLVFPDNTGEMVFSFPPSSTLFLFLRRGDSALGVYPLHLSRPRPPASARCMLVTSLEVMGEIPSLLGPTSDSSFWRVESWGPSLLAASFAARAFTQITSSFGGALDSSSLPWLSLKLRESLPS